MSINRPCPRCGSKDVIPIVYGDPSYDLFLEEKAGKVALGGPVEEARSPNLQCRDCGKKFKNQKKAVKPNQAKAPKRTVSMVVGNFDDPLNEAIADIAKVAIEDRFDLKIESFTYGEDLLEKAAAGGADLYVLVLSNIRFRSPSNSDQRGEKSLRLLAKIKSIAEKPVIALAPSSLGSLPERAIHAADCFIPLPFHPADLMNAIRLGLQP